MVERNGYFVTVDYPDFNMRVAKVAKQYLRFSYSAFRRGLAAAAKMVWRSVRAAILFAYEAEAARLLNLWAILLLISIRSPCGR